MSQPNRPRRRGAISAESTSSENLLSQVLPPKVAKNGTVLQYLERVLSNNILFSHLQKEERQELFEYMTEMATKAGFKVIEQDDPNADNFYVVESGHLDVFKDYHDGKEPSKVYEYGPGGFFGELALMYNMPRAATVTSRDDVKLWAIDRVTFRHFLMETTKRKRELYQEFLERVPLLQNLDKYERLTVADALMVKNFVAGETIIEEGKPGETFYLLVKGEVKITKQGVETPNSPLQEGAYFGEIALLSDAPRQATITAVGDVRCATLDRDAFTRLLGPCEDILRRSIEAYSNLAVSVREMSESVDEVPLEELVRQEVKKQLKKQLKKLNKDKKSKKSKKGKKGEKKGKKSKKDKKGKKKKKK